ncbi:MAG: hypothetical protein AB7O78_01605 [Thermoleophilia bacterium]
MKSILIVDAATEIPATAFRLDEPAAHHYLAAAVISRAGYGLRKDDQRGHVALISWVGPRVETDPFAWSDLTLRCAHLRLLEDFDSVPDGGALDVERMRLALIDAMGTRSQVEDAWTAGAHDRDDPRSVAP